MEEEYFRTFIGLPVLAGNRLLSAREELMEALSGERISWVQPLNYHITLRFLGDTSRSDMARIKESLLDKVVLPRRSEFRLSGPGSFGPRKKPRVIWMGLEQAEPLERLKQEVDVLLESLGVPASNQPFRAHLTLGRVRSVKNLSHLYETIHRVNQSFSDQVVIDRLVYYRSVLGASGSSYSSLAERVFEA